MKNIIPILFVILLAISTNAMVINIPGDYLHIQTGINQATIGDTILIQPGIYVENIDFSGKNITVASLFLTTQDSSYISQTVIDGNQDGRAVTFNSGEDTTAILCGLTITNGNGGISCSNNSNSILTDLIITENSAQRGGGLEIIGSSPKLINMTISYNSAIGEESNDGGGIFLYGDSNPYMEDIEIFNNHADGDGGGLCVDMYANSHIIQNIRTSNINIIENWADGSGGGVCIIGEGLDWHPCVVLSNVVIMNNHAELNGGGIASINITPHIKNNQILGNYSTGYGGGISVSHLYGYFNELYEGVIKGNQVSDNTSLLGGGGINIQDSNGIKVIDNIITENISDDSDGGGIGCYESFYDIMIFNNVICDNNARSGGGIFLSETGYIFDVISSNTICNNSATLRGGGLDSGESIKLYNSIVWGNVASEGSQIATDGDYSEFLYCDIENGEEGIIFDDPLFTLDESNINTEPSFENNLENLYSLASNSPCINMGIPDTTGLNLPDIDLAGNPRIYEGESGRIDMGAYEYQGIPTIVTMPVFLPVPGTYNELQEVTISCVSPGANIYYTTDGTEPNETSELYIEPIPLSQTTCLKAKVFKDGFYPSLTTTGLYVVGTFVQGELSGHWLLENSPYCVVNDITIPDGETLTIEPGVHVLFADLYEINVQGRLLAQGTENDSILFSSYPGKKGAGIAFIQTPSTNDSSFISYSTIESMLSRRDFQGFDGGPIYINGFSKLKISHCNIRNNISLFSGGGIHCIDSDFTISNTVINNNYASAYGGGLASSDYCQLHLENVTFENNRCNFGGGGLACWNSIVKITNGLIHNNKNMNDELTIWGGGGIFFDTSDIILKNVTLTKNFSDQGGTTEGSGIFGNGGGYNLNITNSIVWDNEGEDIWINSRGNFNVTINISYSNIEDGEDGIATNGNATLNWLDGNMERDPLFFDSENQDFHLHPFSFCVDSGDPTFDYALEPEPNGGCINMGMYGNTPEATISEGVVTMPDVVVDSIQFFVPIFNYYEYFDPVNVETHFSYNPDILQFVSISDEDTQMENWFILSEETSPGKLEILGFSEYPLDMENDTLLNLCFNTLQSNTIDTLHFDSALFANTERPTKSSIINLSNVADIQPLSINIPLQPSLKQNYPNPFNPTTTIAFTIPHSEENTRGVELQIYDISGKLIKTLVDQPIEAGYHSVIWDGKDEGGNDVASGLYLYRIKTIDLNRTKQCLLLK